MPSSMFVLPVVTQGVEEGGVRRHGSRLRACSESTDVSEFADAQAALPEGDPDGDARDRLAAFLADVANTWQVATPTKQNTLTRQLFAGMVFSNRKAVAVVPRPDLRPFFFPLPRLEAVNPGGTGCTGGSAGDRFRVF